MRKADEPRRWFQFGVGTLLLFTALVAVSVLAFLEHVKRIRAETLLDSQTQSMKFLQAAYDRYELPHNYLEGEATTPAPQQEAPP